MPRDTVAEIIESAQHLLDVLDRVNDNEGLYPHEIQILERLRDALMTHERLRVARESR